jgi:hypothetical protein
MPEMGPSSSAASAAPMGRCTLYQPFCRYKSFFNDVHCKRPRTLQRRTFRGFHPRGPFPLSMLQVSIDVAGIRR